LFLLAHSCFVPLFAVLAAAAEIGNSDDETFLEQEDVESRVVGSQADVEASIRGQERRPLTVGSQTLLVNEKHRDLRAVLGGVPDLFGLKQGRIDRNVGLLENEELPGSKVIAEIRRRDSETGKRQEHFLVVRPTRQGADGSDSRQGEILLVPAVKAVNGDGTGGITQVAENELAIDDRSELQIVFGLRHDLGER